MFLRINTQLTKTAITLASLFWLGLSFAQTGPGGVGNSSNNVLWLDANHKVYSDTGTTLALNNSNVQQWNDRSGNGRNAFQDTAAYRPNLNTNSLNGMPTLRFTAANADRLTSTNITTGNQASVWMIASYATLPVGNAGLLQATPSGLSTSILAGDKAIGLWVRSNTAQLWGRGVQSNNNNNDLPLGSVLNVNNSYIINSVYRSNRIDKYVNNVSSSNTSHNGTLKSWTDVMIGRQSTESWNGNIAEVIFYNTAVNTAQRIIIDNYLAAKYGLSLGSDDLYTQDNPGNGNFDFEVAGIGRINPSNIHNDAQGSGMVRILSPTNLSNNRFLMWGHNNALAEALDSTDIPSGVDARFNRVWRFSEVSTSGNAVNIGDINIRFDLNSLGNINSSDISLLIDQDNDGTFSDETPITNPVDLGSGIFEFQSVAPGTGSTRDNKSFTIATIPQTQTLTLLPLVFLNFKAIKIANNMVKLDWQTEGEYNRQFFTIEKSEDGINWVALSTIGANITNSLAKYNYLDENPIVVLAYYRLKQTNFNGEFNYSNTIKMNVENQIRDVMISPNPSSDFIDIVGESIELSYIRVFNLLGLDITNQLNMTEITPERFKINISQLSSGYYLIKTATKSHSFYKQ